MRLIDAEFLKAQIQGMYMPEYVREGLNTVIDNTPTVEERPTGVIQGRLLKILVNKAIISKNEFLFITAQINESELEESRKEKEADNATN